MARSFLLARPTPEYTTRFTRQSQQHVAQHDVQSDSAGVQGGIVLDMLRHLLQKPSYTEDDIMLIQEINSLSQQLISRLLDAGHQPPASTPIEPPPALAPVLTPESAQWNRQHEAHTQAPGRPEVPAASVQTMSTPSQPLQAGGTQPTTLQPQHHVATTSPLVVRLLYIVFRMMYLLELYPFNMRES